MYSKLNSESKTAYFEELSLALAAAQQAFDTRFERVFAPQGEPEFI